MEQKRGEGLKGGKADQGMNALKRGSWWNPFINYLTWSSCFFFITNDSHDSLLKLFKILHEKMQSGRENVKDNIMCIEIWCHNNDLH